MTDNYDPPAPLWYRWIAQCRCCVACHQAIPCAGVMQGGLCDGMCSCNDDLIGYDGDGPSVDSEED